MLGLGLVGATVASQAGDAYDPYNPGPRYGADGAGANGSDEPLRYPPSYGGNNGQYDGGYNRPRNHARGYGYDGRRRHCLTQKRIRRQLRNAGYYQIQWRKARHSTINYHAWHDDGRLYRLQVDRCNGEIVRSHVLLNGGGPRDYRNGNLRPYQSSNAVPHRSNRHDYRLY